MVFVSVIIAFNKGERYLKDCLDSLSEQNLQDAEIIIILNGCKEDVDELLNSYTDLNLVVKSYDEELGVGKSRNEGLDIASGEYVYFMDSDDYLYQNGLAKLIDVAKENNYDLVNGERVATYFIRDRFEENPTIMNEKQLQQLDSSDMEYSFKMLTGTKTNRLEIESVV